MVCYFIRILCAYSGTTLMTTLIGVKKMTKRRPKKMAKKKSEEKKLKFLKSCEPVLPGQQGRYYRRNANRYWIRGHLKRNYRN